MRQAAIYILYDIHGATRYVGKTVHLRDRFNDHCLEKSWVAGIKVIEWVAEEDWQNREKFWIKFYKDLGIKLENMTVGGAGFTMTPEIKEKLRLAATGYKHTEEAKQKVSLANKGKVTSQETKDKIRASLLGRKHTPERCKNMSIGRSGIPHTEETKKRIRATMNTPEAKEFFGSFRRGVKLTEEERKVIILGLIRRYKCRTLQ